MKNSANIKLLNYIDENHKDCLWYGGTVAEIEYNNYIFQIVANGDVIAHLFDNDERDMDSRELAWVKDKSNLGSFYGEFRDYIENDEGLQAAFEYHTLSLDSNNWFELFVVDPEGYDVEEWNIVLDSGDIENAIFETINMLDEIVRTIERE